MGSFQQRNDALTVEAMAVRLRKTGQFAQRRIQIDQFDKRFSSRVLFTVRRTNDQRNAEGLIKRVVFAPEIVLAQQPEVVPIRWTETPLS
jgi:hypothetical protein